MILYKMAKILYFKSKLKISSLYNTFPSIFFFSMFSFFFFLFFSCIDNSTYNFNQSYIFQKVNAQTNFDTSTLSTDYSNNGSLSTIKSSLDYNFVVVGDWSCNSQSKKNMKLIEAQSPELLIVPGDLSYKSNGDCWINLISPLDNITKIAFGNHEVAEGSPKSLSEQYKDHFNLNSTYYSFDYETVHFLIMNSEDAFDKGSAQYSYVLSDLNKISKNQLIKWIFVIFHTPMYTSPTNHPSNIEFRDIYHPLFDNFGVDLVLQAHNHNYQRSYPLQFNETDSSNPIITDNGNNNYLNPKGQIYATVGTGGKSLYNLKDKSNFIATQFEEYGFLDLKLVDNGNKLIANFVSSDNKHEKILDDFSINK